MKTKTTSGLLCIVLSAVLFSPEVVAKDGVPIFGWETGVSERVDLQFPILTWRFTANGVASHLGRYSADALFVVNVISGDELSTSLSRSSARGDQLFSTELDIIPLEPNTGLIVGKFTGGTGRFEGATGWYIYLAQTENPIGTFPNPFRATWFGQLSVSNGK